jgi:hypothetical protein
MPSLAGPVSVADLTVPDCLARWPVFAPAAAQAGVRAVFALPLQVGAIRLGVLSLSRAQPGDLDREQLADALVLADTACALLLDAAQTDGPRPDGHWPEQAVPQHPEVHQATGMIIVQLGVTAAVALIRLRAYAYAHDRRLRDVAADVVARRLRFHPTPTLTPTPTARTAVAVEVPILPVSRRSGPAAATGYEAARLLCGEGEVRWPRSS